LLKQIPNILTALRLLLVLPIIILFFWLPTSAQIQFWVLMLVILASVTDWLDGWYARKFNCISDFGKVHDPLADKWLTVLYLPLVALNMIHFLPVAFLWLRDITSTHLRSLAAKPVAAKLSGKIKTAISLPLLCLLVAAVPVEGSYFGFFIFMKGLFYWVGGILLSLVCLWSGVDYYYQSASWRTRKITNSFYQE